MATELNFNKDEDEDKNDVLTSSSAPLTGGSGQAQPQQATRPSTPSGRPNVQQYLNANQGAGEKLAGGIQSNFQKQADNVNKGIQDTRSLLQSSSQPLETNLGQQGSDNLKTAFKDPAAILGQQTQLDEFRRLQNQGYNQNIGALQDVYGSKQQELSNQANTLASGAGMAGTESGRFQLLRSAFGQPNYTQGQQKLDQLFLQAQPGVNRSLNQNLQGIQKQTETGLGNFANESSARLDALNKLSAERALEAKNLLSGGLDASGLESDMSGRGFDDIKVSSEQRLADAQSAVNSIPGLRERLAQNKLTSADLSALGLSAGTQLYDTDLSQFINQSDRTPTLAGAADPAEVARYRALQQLAGDTSGDIFGGAETVGDFSPFDYRKDDLMSTIAQRQNYFEQERPKQLADELANVFGSPSSGGGMRSSRSPLADYGYNVLAPGLRSAKNAEEIQQQLQAYDQELRKYGLDINSGGLALSSLRPYLDQLQGFLNEANTQRQRNLQPVVDDLVGNGIITS